jgi:hypothetical protein
MPTAAQLRGFSTSQTLYFHKHFQISTHLGGGSEESPLSCEGRPFIASGILDHDMGDSLSRSTFT